MGVGEGGNGSTCARVFALALTALVVLQPACAGHGRRRPASVPDPRAFVESFISKVVAADHDGAFADLDIDVLLNYRRPQGELYRSLSPTDQQRYRRDFIDGIYAFLFRETAPGRAVWRVEIDAGNALQVDVVGRPGKRLRLTLKAVPAGLRIVAFAKAEG